MEKPPDAAAPGRQRRRRLRAVFAADAANFGGLVSVDETKTLDSLWTTRRIATQELGKHGGWLFGMPGDGIFALFESAIDAVRCALEIQRRLAEQPAASILNLRVGIHLGEVLFQDEIPFGEALVIAARLESLAEPGGILVSQSVMEAVAPRIHATFVDQGVRSLKHSPRQIKTYVVVPPGREDERSPTDSETHDRTRSPAGGQPSPPAPGSTRPPDPGPDAVPVVETLPLPLPPSPALREPAHSPEAGRPATAQPEPEPLLQEQTVFLPGRRLAAWLAEASGPAGDEPAAALMGPDTGSSAGGADEPAPAPRDEPPAVPGVSTLSTDDLAGEHAGRTVELPPEPEFDPDRTVLVPRRPAAAAGIAPLPKASPFQLPEPPAGAVPTPGTPAHDPAAKVRVQAAVPDIAHALTSYLGPIARVLVKRNAETCSSPQALIEAVALEIPADAERQAFRERAAALVSRLK